MFKKLWDKIFEAIELKPPVAVRLPRDQRRPLKKLLEPPPIPREVHELNPLLQPPQPGRVMLPRPMRALLHRLSQLPESSLLILRGSAALALLESGEARVPGDLDFITTDEAVFNRVSTVLNNACQMNLKDGFYFSFNPEPAVGLWTYSDTPGIRHFIRYSEKGFAPADCLQIDVAFGEPVTLPPMTFRLKGHSEETHFELPVNCPEQALAWKLRWIADEFEGEDIFDAALIVARQTLNAAAFQRAFVEAFEFNEVSTETEMSTETIVNLCNVYGHNPISFMGSRMISMNQQQVSIRQCQVVLALHLPRLLNGTLHIPSESEWEFLNNIKLHPGEIEHQLVYADWLEEQGDVRGEFIRLLVAPDSAEHSRRLRELTDQIDSYWVDQLKRL